MFSIQKETAPCYVDPDSCKGETSEELSKRQEPTRSERRELRAKKIETPVKFG